MMTRLAMVRMRNITIIYDCTDKNQNPYIRRETIASFRNRERDQLHSLEPVELFLHPDLSAGMLLDQKYLSGDYDQFNVTDKIKDSC